MNALLEGKLEKIYYPLFIKAQFDIFKKIFEATKQCPLITPTIISSNKALSRWNVWKYYYEKVKSIEDKLVRLQDLYIEGNIEKSEYKIAKERYDVIHQELKSNEVELKDKKRVVEIYESVLMKLESIGYQ
jgi:hypothetical protein